MAFRILSMASVCHDADSIQTSVVRVAPSSHQTGSKNKLLRGLGEGIEVRKTLMITGARAYAYAYN